MNNTVKALFCGGKTAKTRSLYQYDYGIRLKIAGLELPSTFEAHFSNGELQETMTAIGQNNVVIIPDVYLTTGLPVWCYIYLHTESDDGETVYKINIPVKKRGKPLDQAPTPEQQSALTTAIAALNDAVEQSNSHLEYTETYKNQAHEYSTAAYNSANNAASSATNAAQSATNAEGYASSAANASTSANNAANRANTSATNAENSANAAQQSAEEAHDYAVTMDQKLLDANQVLSATRQARDEAVDAKDDAETAVSHYPKIVDDYWQVWDTATGVYINTGVNAKGIKGDPGEDADPTLLIDDTAGDGVTDKTWSADKIVDELANAGSVKDVKINNTSIVGQDGIANIPIATGAVDNPLGLVKANENRGISIGSDGSIQIFGAASAGIKEGMDGYKPITPYYQHESVFYGLAKVSGDTTQSLSDNVVGQYTDSAKASIRNMIGAPSIDDIPETPVQDVQVNGTSVLDGNVAQIPIADNNSNYGVVKINQDNGIAFNGVDHSLRINFASGNIIKTGTDLQKPIVPYHQHYSTFYGLAKAAGDTTQSQSNNAVGTYTDEAKSAIQTMLGVPSVDDIPDVPVTDVQIDGTSIVDAQGNANIPYAGTSAFGVTKIGSGLFRNSEMKICTDRASSAEIKTGTDLYKSIVPYNQHESAFYGLSKAAGVDLANETVTFGTYPATSQAAIKSMIGVNVDDVQVNGTSVVSNGVANVPLASQNSVGVVSAQSQFGVRVGDGGILVLVGSSTQETQGGTNSLHPVMPVNQHLATFYGLAKASGDTTQSASSNAVGTYTDEAKASIQTMLGVPSADEVVKDVSIDGTSIVDANGNAVIPIGGTNLGVVRGDGGYGVYIGSSGNIVGKLVIAYAGENQMRPGAAYYNPITPKFQHVSAFYALAKAAGADMKDITGATVGVYPEAQKSAIHEMLSGSITISGTTPTINALPGLCYICGECLTLTVNLPASGCVDVQFESGSTPTVLTIVPASGQTVKWANGFDPDTLDADTTYEINIADGLGVAGSWT